MAYFLQFALNLRLTNNILLHNVEKKMYIAEEEL